MALRTDGARRPRVGRAAMGERRIRPSDVPRQPDAYVPRPGPGARGADGACSFPDHAMCGASSEGGETRTWCGTGWTGQPAVFERDGRTWLVFGAYDYKVHFVDGETGERILPDFPTGDIIKGSVTIDPDGYPLVYTGSRDNYLRVIAIDRAEPTELWKLERRGRRSNAVEQRLGRIATRLERPLARRRREQPLPHRRAESRIRPRRTGDRRTGARVPHAGWDDELLGRRRPKVSIEESVAVPGDTAWVRELRWPPARVGRLVPPHRRRCADALLPLLVG